VLHQLSLATKRIKSKPSLINKKLPAQTLESIENEDARFKMVSEAAYYRALGRGFNGDDQLQDWLISEVTIDGLPPNHS
jgi:hypothetical protein